MKFTSLYYVNYNLCLLTCFYNVFSEFELLQVFFLVVPWPLSLNCECNFLYFYVLYFFFYFFVYLYFFFNVCKLFSLSVVRSGQKMPGHLSQVKSSQVEPLDTFLMLTHQRNIFFDKKMKKWKKWKIKNWMTCHFWPQLHRPIHAT